MRHVVSTSGFRIKNANKDFITFVCFRRENLCSKSMISKVFQMHIHASFRMMFSFSLQFSNTFITHTKLLWFEMLTLELRLARTHSHFWVISGVLSHLFSRMSSRSSLYIVSATSWNMLDAIPPIVLRQCWISSVDVALSNTSTTLTTMPLAMKRSPMSSWSVRLVMAVRASFLIFL